MAQSVTRAHIAKKLRASEFIRIFLDHNVQRSTQDPFPTHPSFFIIITITNIQVTKDNKDTANI